MIGLLSVLPLGVGRYGITSAPHFLCSHTLCGFIVFLFCFVLLIADTLQYAQYLSYALQRFTNEDHLSVHKHKHEMTLKFGPARTDSVIIAGKDVTIIISFYFSWLK